MKAAVELFLGGNGYMITRMAWCVFPQLTGELMEGKLLKRESKN